MKLDNLETEFLGRNIFFYKNIDSTQSEIWRMIEKNIIKKSLNCDIENLIAKREEARKNKQWQKADEIREELLKKGIVIQDTKEGVKIDYIKK